MKAADQLFRIEQFKSFTVNDFKSANFANSAICGMSPTLGNFAESANILPGQLFRIEKFKSAESVNIKNDIELRRPSSPKLILSAYRCWGVLVNPTQCPRWQSSQLRCSDSASPATSNPQHRAGQPCRISCLPGLPRYGAGHERRLSHPGQPPG